MASSQELIVGGGLLKHEQKDDWTSGPWKEGQPNNPHNFHVQLEEVGVSGVEMRDKRQYKHVREWQEIWIYCCVTFITDEGLCARRRCSCAHQTPSRKRDMGFLFNACVYVNTCAYKYGIQISGSRQHREQRCKKGEEGRCTQRETDNCMLTWFYYFCFHHSFMPFFDNWYIIMCAAFVFHIFKWFNTFNSLKFGLWGGIQSFQYFVYDTFPLKADKYTVYIVLSCAVIFITLFCETVLLSLHLIMLGIWSGELILLDIDLKTHLNHPNVLLLFSWIKLLLLLLHMHSSQLVPK